MINNSNTGANIKTLRNRNNHNEGIGEYSRLYNVTMQLIVWCDPSDLIL